MCGIAGFVARPGFGRSSRAQEVLRAIEHRGPDDLGWLRLTEGRLERGRVWTEPACEPEVLLLHRRLSILDVTEAGWQPMSSCNGRYHVIFNGEIYNYKELREELRALGCCFHSQSDTEVLLAAYARWGTNALRRFVGMFAFALLDLDRSTVLLARDFFGIKPLYYTLDEDLLCFGSEIKALLAFGLKSREVNPERLLYFLRYGMTDFGAETMFAKVHQLPPAHFMEISIATGIAQEPQCFWQPETADELDISFDEAAKQLRDLFLRSVELHLRSDVPVGSALSGGIDSSSIVMAMRHLDSRAEIHAFSFISEDEQTSEERWIDLVVREAAAHCHKVHMTSTDIVANVEELSRVHDEPFAPSSTYAQREVFRLAEKCGVKVMLDGQGADEILAGYRLYLGARLASLIRIGEWSSVAKLLRGMSTQTGFSKVRGLAFCTDFLLPPSLQGPARKFAGKEAFPAWLNRQWFADRGAGIVVSNYTRTDEVLKHSLYRSLREGLPSLLRYEDRNSMASSVESRVPFLTPDLVNFLGRLPERYLIAPDGTSKAVFRKAMRGIVPDAILDRRDKVGFATPEIHWLRELDGWVRGILSSESAMQLPFLDLKVARQEWDAIREGRKAFDLRVWRWMSLIRWTEEFGVTFNN